MKDFAVWGPTKIVILGLGYKTLQIPGILMDTVSYLHCSTMPRFAHKTINHSSQHWEKPHFAAAELFLFVLPSKVWSLSFRDLYQTQVASSVIRLTSMLWISRWHCPEGCIEEEEWEEEEWEDETDQPASKEGKSGWIFREDFVGSQINLIERKFIVNDHEFW
jgi:hypothetical protein